MRRATTRAQRIARTLRAGFLVAALLVMGLVLAEGVLGESPSPGTSATPGTSPSAAPSASSAAPTYVPWTPAPATAAPTAPLASPTPSLPAPGASPTVSLPPIPLPTPIAHPGDGSKNTCYECHVAVNDEQREISQTWQESVHGKGGIGCADCHGGDPTSDVITVAMDPAIGFIGTPSRSSTVGICGSCHSDPNRMQQYGLATDQYTKYQTSVHGEKLAAGDVRVAICVDCHGSHGVKKASDPTAAVYPLNVPQLCSSCHADPRRMQPYSIPTDQFDQYKLSVHGVALLGTQDVRAPSCVSCHGSHSAKPPSSTEVVGVCGKCHTATQALYEQSRHNELGDNGPKCITCHGAHDVVQPDETRFIHAEATQYQCTTCHDPLDQSIKFQPERFQVDSERRCDTCHHPKSMIYSQVQGIHSSLEEAATAYESADKEIGRAASVGMIVSDAEVKLADANTSLVQARAAVHTSKLTTIDALTREATTKANEAEALAKVKIDESTFRRTMVIFVIIVISLMVVGLYWLARQLRKHEPD